MALPKKKNEFIDDHRKDATVLDEVQMKELFDARCSDLEIESKEK